MSTRALKLCAYVDMYIVIDAANFGAQLLIAIYGWNLRPVHNAEVFCSGQVIVLPTRKLANTMGKRKYRRKPFPFFLTLRLGFDLLFSSSARKNAWKIDGRTAKTEVWPRK